MCIENFSKLDPELEGLISLLDYSNSLAIASQASVFLVPRFWYLVFSEEINGGERVVYIYTN